MTFDDTLLLAHRAYRDERIGIAEEFLSPPFGSGRTVAVLATPTAAAGDTGVVICHSFATEQMHLSRVETRIARALAGAGYPTFRYHGHGYGDADEAPDGVTFASHVQDARDAVDLLMERSGVRSVATLGAKLGGAVAALLADERDLPMLVMIEPMVQGRQYMRDFIRSEVFSSMAGDLGDEFLPTSADEAAGADPRLASEGQQAAGDSGEVTDLRERLRTEGRVDIKGFVLTRETHDAVAVVDLLTDMTRFAGRSLVLGVSRTGSPSATQTRLAARLRELGGACSLTAIADRQAARFGQYHYAAAGDQSGEKGDTQFGMATAIVGAVTGWVTGSGHEESTDRDDRIAEAR